MPNGIRALPASLFIIKAVIIKISAIESKNKPAPNPCNASSMESKVITSSNISYFRTGETSSKISLKNEGVEQLNFMFICSAPSNSF